MTHVAAVDFGATSVRVCRVDVDARPVTVEVVHRHAHKPVGAPDGSLRWDWDRLVDEMFEGLELALGRGPIASIGVDTWAVDYGLLDGDGKLLSAPHSYRSERTQGFRRLLDRIGARHLYETCGLQVQPFNTIFQLAAHDPSELEAAEHLLFLPDLLVHHLTEEVGTERTSAGSSALYDLAARTWSDELIEAAGAPRRLFGEIVDAPSAAGAWRGIPVYRVGGHDSASAAVANRASAFVSSGTWLIVGCTRDEPDISPSAQEENFSNELGALGGIRFLKNVAGFWLVNECLRAWGIDDGTGLLAAARAVSGDVPIFDATDPSLLAPVDMEAEIRRLTRLPSTAGRDVVVRCAIESMAATASEVIRRIGARDAVIVGGGAHDDFLAERIADRAGVPVRRGPTEAAALGNALVQGIALGAFQELEDAQRAIA